MGIRQIKKYEIQCDSCKVTKLVESYSKTSCDDCLIAISNWTIEGMHESKDRDDWWYLCYACSDKKALKDK